MPQTHYEQHVTDFGGKETPQSNPDIIADDWNIFNPDLKDIIDTFKDLDFSTIMSKQECQVLKMVVMEGMKTDEIIKTLNIGRKHYFVVYCNMRKKLIKHIGGIN